MRFIFKTVTNVHSSTCRRATRGCTLLSCHTCGEVYRIRARSAKRLRYPPFNRSFFPKSTTFQLSPPLSSLSSTHHSARMLATQPNPPHASTSVPKRPLWSPLVFLLLLQHDAQLDFFGKTLATCSSDRTIKIFKVTPDTEQHTLVKELRGHDGPVWKVAWAHPMFGQMLASCSHDAKVMIWKDGKGAAQSSA